MISRPSGLSLVSFFLGLTIGLIVAAYIAFYVTKTPVPFIDRLNDTNLIDPGDIKKVETGAVEIKIIPDKEVIFPQDQIESLISSRDALERDQIYNKKFENSSLSIKQYDQSEKTILKKINKKVLKKNSVQVFYLQVGAFRSIDEADRMRARLAFLGFEASLYKKSKPGSVFYRVRLGPFSSKEELNRVRKRLSEDKIKSNVVLGEKNQ